MNIVDVFHEQVAHRPDANAIIDRAGRVTFQQLDDQSAQAAALLAKQGLQPGDVVLVLVPMSIDLYVALLAVFRLGCVAMVIDPSAVREQIDHCCAIGKPKGFIGVTKAHLLRLKSRGVRAIPHRFRLGRCPIPGAVNWSKLDRCEPLRDIHPTAPDTPALLTFTSGSTGQPKAAMRTHGFLIAQHRALVESIDLQPGQVDLCTLPVFALANLGLGVTTVVGDAAIKGGRRHIEPVVQLLREHRPDRTCASPTFFTDLFASASADDTASLRQLFTGGSPVFPNDLSAFSRRVDRAVAVYGSTEAEPIAHIAFDEMSKSDLKQSDEGGGLLAGAPVPQVTLRILSDAWGGSIGPFDAQSFEANCVAVNEPGEIVVTGDHVLKGYVDGIGDEETKFRVDGKVWHRTGDAGYLDKAGRLWLLGRCAARIDDEHGRLYPFSVEVVARQCEGVRRAAVVQVDQARTLVIEPDEDAPFDLDACRQRVAWAHCRVVMLPQPIPLDKRHHAKIDYPALHGLLKLG